MSSNKTKKSGLTYDEISAGQWTNNYQALYRFLGYMKWDEAIECIKWLKEHQEVFENTIANFGTSKEH